MRRKKKQNSYRIIIKTLIYHANLFSVCCLLTITKNTQKHQTTHNTEESRKTIPSWMWAKRNLCWIVQLRSISSLLNRRSGMLEPIAATAPRNTPPNRAKGKAHSTHSPESLSLPKLSHLNHNKCTDSSTCFMPATSNHSSYLTSLINVAAVNLRLIIP